MSAHRPRGTGRSFKSEGCQCLKRRKATRRLPCKIKQGQPKGCPCSVERKTRLEPELRPGRLALFNVTPCRLQRLSPPLVAGSFFAHLYLLRPYSSSPPLSPPALLRHSHLYLLRPDSPNVHSSSKYLQIPYYRYLIPSVHNLRLSFQNQLIIIDIFSPFHSPNPVS